MDGDVRVEIPDASPELEVWIAYQEQPDDGNDPGRRRARSTAIKKVSRFLSTSQANMILNKSGHTRLELFSWARFSSRWRATRHPRRA